MSPQPSIESTPTSQPNGQQSGQPEQPRQSATARLAELKRALQRQLKRKPTAYEKSHLDRAAYMLLRHEMACRDPNSSSEDIVRLHNASRRAVADYERVAGITGDKRQKQRTMADIEAELAHAR